MPAGRSVPSRKANNTKARFNADYSAHWTATNTNTTNLSSMGTRLGGNTQQTYLGSVVQMPTIGAPGGSASHSGVGVISGGSGPTDSEFNDLNTAYNNAADFMNGVATVLAGLISELRAAKLMN